MLCIVHIISCHLIAARSLFLLFDCNLSVSFFRKFKCWPQTRQSYVIEPLNQKNILP